MATVTTELSPGISATLDRLEALYYEFDRADSVYDVFDKILELKLQLKLPENI
jgi:hypothetical protein